MSERGQRTAQNLADAVRFYRLAAEKDHTEAQRNLALLHAGAQGMPYLMQGQAPPDFTLSDTAGRTVRLSDFKGRVILLSFWSCYTDTCFASTAAYAALIEKLGPRGLASPTSCQEIPEALAADGYAGLIKRCSVGQTILVDPERRVAASYFVREHPTTFLIGPEYSIREILNGVAPLRDPNFLAQVEELVNRVAPSNP